MNQRKRAQAGDAARAGAPPTAAPIVSAPRGSAVMPAAHSLELRAGWAVTARVLSRRLAVVRPLRASAAARARGRLLLAAVPATPLGHLAAAGAAPAGPRSPQPPGRPSACSPSPCPPARRDSPKRTRC
ncbi:MULTISPECIES: hypothetical protein [unclassified Streptomyces]|uniref:hypothetical protein n=1 Tax=unclassified Streptomyces TaxID=2593676 RepID=UPI001EF10373|nr:MULTISPECIES: hypothetical protein [unclassified Streptomyces]